MPCCECCWGIGSIVRVGIQFSPQHACSLELFLSPFLKESLIWLEVKGGVCGDGWPDDWMW